MIKVSLFADFDNLDENMYSAKIIADKLGINVNIHPHLNIDNHKKPEYEINGVIGDGTNRTGDIKNFIGNSFKKLCEGG